MIEFLEEDHIYLLNGIITPSVTEILSKILFKNKYANIPKNILDSKAKYGSIVHKYIECLESKKELPQINYLQELSIDQYLKIKKENNIEVLSQEQMVHYKDIYCGTYDMIANVNGVESLIDVKTTASLDEEYLSWQLSFYELAIGREFKKMYCIWLPKKNLGRLVEIHRKDKEKILKKLEEIC